MDEIYMRMVNMAYLKEINKRWLTILLLTLSCLTGISQELYFEQFTDLDGLPSLMTYEMVQDSHGVLWIGTENGLTSYDGENFQRHSHPQLIDNDIIEIALDKKGRVYFLNLSHQLAFIDEDSVQIINTEALDGNIVNVFTTYDKSYLQLRNQKQRTKSKEFFQIEDNNFAFKNTKVNVFQLEDDVYYKSKISTTDSGKQTFQTDLDKLIFNSKIHTGINKSNDSRYFYFDGYSAFYEMDSIISEYINHQEFGRLVNSKGKIFLVFNKGVILYDLKTQEFHSIFKSKAINSVFVDKEKNIWFSSQNEGLLKIPYLSFQLDSRSSDFVENFGINDIQNDDNGNKYIGTTSGQVLIYSKANKLIKSQTVSERPRQVTLQKRKDKFYGISGFNFFEIDVPSNNINILDSKTISFKCLMFHDSHIYLGTRSGIIIKKLENLKDSNLYDLNDRKFEGHWINSLLVNESNDNLYIGTSIGLYKKDKLDSYEPVSIEGLDKYNISYIARGEQNSIWIGTRSMGVFKLMGDKVVDRFNISNGLPSNNVNSLKILNNQLIVSTVDGLGIKILDSGETKTIKELSGIIPKEIFAANIIEDEYWLGSNSGLSIVSTNQLESFKRDGPILSIKNLYANGEKIEYHDNLQFSYKINTILINFRNVSLQNSKNKSIKYRISSSDTSWVYSSDPLIRLQSLKHGKYTAEVVGLNSKKDEGNKISLAFTINPPWWQTWWARLLGFLLLVFVVWAIVKNRSGRIRKEELTKRNYLTQINNIKEQALQLQMNPHFIFNSLNAIQNFIGTDEEELAMNYLARFARLIRLIFEYSKGNTISLEEELEFMNLYLNLEKLRFKDKVNIKLTVDVDVEANKDFVNIPPLLIQPIVENSFKHGLFHKKGKGNLKINYTIKGKILEVVIEDDGVGRTHSKKISQKNSEKQSSSGLKTTQERIELLNFGKDKSQNSMIVEDLYFEDGSAAGTKTILNLAF